MPSLDFKTVISIIGLFLFVSGSFASDRAKLVEYFSARAVSLDNVKDLDRLIEQAGSRKLVLLGEATHGSAEFYRWRAEITKRLISEKGFSLIAVEGDWASIYRLNEYVKARPGSAASASDVLRGFSRWPRWMWANREIERLATWLREYNLTVAADRRVGFYGMDVYGQWQAVDDLLEYVKKDLPDKYEAVRKNLQCFANKDRDEWDYARSVAAERRISCVRELKNVTELLMALSREIIKSDRDKDFRAQQNAIVIQKAEEFYRLAVGDGDRAWNSRATHMWETVERLLAHYEEGSKAIVWAHNTHVGDADATTMTQAQRTNIGRLSRRALGEDRVFIVGFGTYRGKVNAGSGWGSAMQEMIIPEPMPGSYEDILGQVDKDRYSLTFDKKDRQHHGLREFRGHRAIGVVYNPRHEMGNYVPTILPRRYDAFIFIRETSPLELVN